MNFNPKNILVTGGCGFLGSNFVNYVCEASPETQITVIDKLTYAGDLRNIEPLTKVAHVEFVEGDVCDSTLINELTKKSDAVVHFAAETHVDNSIADPVPFVHSNIIGTFTVLEACRAHNVRLHHVSTDEVFGDSCDFPVQIDAFTPKVFVDMGVGRFNENSSMKPSSPYSATKASSDLLVQAWMRTYGVPATISHASNCFGTRQHVEKFIPKCITNILKGEKPVLYGDGECYRDWLHADDHSSAVWKILTEGELGESYCVSAICLKSNIEVLQAILQLMDKPSDFFEFTEDRPGHDRAYMMDASKIKQDLGWVPEHCDFEDSLKNIINWYSDNRDWWV
ncbi:MAG: dTDP-glucose 4,6-dehydratase [Phoenicibacter congonensis]|uniref:dTDP-glucose 4,6-dehydratase n=1 Tax=Phoenicibacter congonensis TaxID=1944646 RepID=A0AA43UAM6_9ACTN|nr:dTDP-glucose 4,6-dehydratase [Phoenicibacter congonensis]